MCLDADPGTKGNNNTNAKTEADSLISEDASVDSSIYTNADDDIYTIIYLCPLPEGLEVG